MRCPAALNSLNNKASSFGEDFAFIACALAQRNDDFDEIVDFSQEWDQLQHIYVDMENKVELKAFFKYSSVPYYIVFDKVYYTFLLFTLELNSLSKNLRTGPLYKPGTPNLLTMSLAYAHFLRHTLPMPTHRRVTTCSH